LTEKWLVAKQFKVKRSASLAKKALTGLPERLVRRVDEDLGAIVASYMPKGTRCKVPCPHPENCPVTGRKRIVPMPQFLYFAASEAADYYKIFVIEDIGGVGAVPGAELKEWLKYIEGLEPPYSLADGTSGGSNGRLTLFEVEKNVTRELH